MQPEHIKAAAWSEVVSTCTAQAPTLAAPCSSTAAPAEPAAAPPSQTAVSSSSLLQDVPAHLLGPYLHGLAPQHRLALLQASTACRDLALGSAPAVQLSIAVGSSGACSRAAAATAALVQQRCPAPMLRLHG